MSTSGRPGGTGSDDSDRWGGAGPGRRLLPAREPGSSSQGARSGMQEPASGADMPQCTGQEHRRRGVPWDAAAMCGLGALAWRPGILHPKQARVRWPGVPLEPVKGWTRAPLVCGVCRQGAGPGRGGLKEAVGGRGGRETSGGWAVRAVGVVEGGGWLSGLPGVRAWGGRAERPWLGKVLLGRGHGLGVGAEQCSAWASGSAGWVRRGGPG